MKDAELRSCKGDGIPRVLFYFRLSVPRGKTFQWLLNELPNKRALNKDLSLTNEDP